MSCIIIISDQVAQRITMTITSQYYVDLAKNVQNRSIPVIINFNEDAGETGVLQDLLPMARYQDVRLW